jgi:hypothetical protein
MTENKYARLPFPQACRYISPPALPSEHIGVRAKIIALFRHMLLNDLITDENSPANKDGFRMVFRHHKWYAGGGDGQFVSHLTTSESQGYGMMLMAYMAGCEDSLALRPEQWVLGCGSLREYFDAMLRTVTAFPSAAGDSGNRLYAWELYGYPRDGDDMTGYKIKNGCKTAPFYRKPTSCCATDGDMDIIFSLLLADKQWGSGGAYDYKQIALDMLKSLWDYCVHPEFRSLLVGDWALGRKGQIGSASRVSDFIPAHLKAYAEADGAHDWNKVLEATYGAIGDLYTDSGAANGLLPDFTVRENGRWRIPKSRVLETNDGVYFYNACRVPWRLGADHLLYGDTPIGGSSLFELAVKPLDGFIKAYTNGDFNLPGALDLNGRPAGAKDPDVFTAPFLVTAAANSAGQDWIDALWSWRGLDEYKGDNYGDYLKLLSMLTAAGYAWRP